MSSEPCLSELAFAKGTKLDDFNPKLYVHRSSRFLECDTCRIVVHTRCYGCEDVSGEKDDELASPEEISDEKWLCERCQDDEIRASCCLCPIRGGAL